MLKAAAATVAAFLIAALAATALGQAPNARRVALLDSTVRFIQDSQQPSGGFAQAGEPSQGASAWAALALAAAGINPRNQAKPCGADAYSYLATHFREAELGDSSGPIVTTALERELLVVDASGTDPHAFAGFDLVREILDRQLPDGSFPYLPGGEAQINTTIFAILALGPVAEPAARAAIREAAEWLLAQRKANGGWHWQSQSTVSEVDMTGVAIEALNAAGPPGAAAFDSAERAALAYLEGAQLPDGGFPALPASESESNVASTAWAVQGIWAAGGDPETWRTGSGLASEAPLDYMESMQQPDGHIRWSRSRDANAIWMTAYVAPAFAGQALPIPAATFSNASRPPCRDEDGGGAGVTAGGGGTGAPLFSRPKPQSRGRTPGGARIVRSKSLDPRNHGRGRRGANARQPTGTETAEAAGNAAERESAAAAVSSATGPGAGSGAGGPAASTGGGNDAGARSSSNAAGASPPISAPLSEAARGAASAVGGRRVSGVVIDGAGSARGGDLAFGAPGLRSAATAGGQELWAAAGIGAAALLAALGGARWERRRGEVLP